MTRTALAVLACLAALPALAEPSYWRVAGVAADDTLNVRAGPSAASEDIGDLPPDQRGIEIAGTDATGDWGRIVWQEGTGWIAMRYLAPDPVQPIAGTALPAGLMCAGTEPFWSMQVSAGSATFSDISGAAVAMGLQGARVAEGRGAFPVQLGHAGPDGSSAALIRPGSCSDGMSDRDYPWLVDLLINTAAGGRYLTGCCHLPLETGFH